MCAVNLGPWRALLLAFGLCWGLLPATAAEIEVIVVTNQQELIEAIHSANASPTTEFIISINADSLVATAIPGTENALPVITGQVHVVGLPRESGLGPRITGGGSGSNFRFAKVAGNGKLTVTNLTFVDFNARLSSGGVLEAVDNATLRIQETMFNGCVAGLGGAVAVQGDAARLHVRRSVFIDCQADQGGAIYVASSDPNALFIDNSAFRDNRADEGGAVKLRGSGKIRESVFAGNSARDGGQIWASAMVLALQYNRFWEGKATGFGCDVFFQQPEGNVLVAAVATLLGNQLWVDECDGQAVKNFGGDLRMVANTIVLVSFAEALLNFGRSQLFNNLFWAAVGSAGSGGADKLCLDVGGPGVISLGSNLSNDGACGFTAPRDLVTANLGVLPPPNVEGIYALAPDSPAIDRGPAGLITVDTQSGPQRLLPCGYKDIRGLGRPQDNNGNGLFECDSGAYELQAGPDLVAAHTGLYFDPARNGEGHFLELLGDGRAVLSTFTYGPNGGMAWFIGVGEVVGNSVVVDEFVTTRGGRFGAAFDPNAIERLRVGGASLVFPDCVAEARPGHFAFQADPQLDFEDLSARAARLAWVLPCTGAPSPLAGRSGGYYAPERSGEGIFVHYLPDGRATLVFYGYTPQGQQFWAVSGEASVSGDTLTAQMLYPASTTRFGSGFVASQIALAPWGTITLTHRGCDELDFSYESSVPGYGAGSHAYTRLTRLQGTSC